MKRFVLLLVVAVVAILSSCNSNYFHAMDERGKIITLRDEVYSKHLEPGDSIIIADIFFEGQYHQNIYGVLINDLPADEVSGNDRVWYFKAVVLK